MNTFGFTFYELVVKYLDGEISLEQLEDLYVPRLSDLMMDPNMSGLLASLELGLAEMDAGFRSEQELRALLEDALVETGRFLHVCAPCDEELRASADSITQQYSIEMGRTMPTTRINPVAVMQVVNWIAV